MGGGSKNRGKRSGKEGGDSRADSSGESDSEPCARPGSLRSFLPPGMTERVSRSGAAPVTSGCASESDANVMNVDTNVSAPAQRESIGVAVGGASKKRKSDAFLNEIEI